MVTGVVIATAVVVMANAGEIEAPADTVTEAGTTAATLLLVSVTSAPPAGAGPLSVMVFWVVGVPPATDWGDRVMVWMAGRYLECLADGYGRARR